MSKEYKKIKFKKIKDKTQDELKRLALEIYQNSHSVRDNVKTDMNLYGEVAKAMIYKSLDGLDNNATQEAIKGKIKEVMLLEGLVAKQDKYLQNFKDKYKEGIDKAADKLAEKIKARGCSPKDAFEAIAQDNPGLFRQIIEFFARCLFISTEYNAMRSVKNQSQEMNEEVKKTEMRRHLVKDRGFEKIAEPQHINASFHKVEKVKKVTGENQAETNKHKQEWFKKNEVSMADRLYWWSATIGDHKKREVIAAEVLRTLMGDNNVPKYRLIEDGSVISKGVGFDKDNGNYKNTRTLGGVLANNDNAINNIMSKAKNKSEAFHEIQKCVQQLNTTLYYTLSTGVNAGFAKELAKLYGYNMIAGNIDPNLFNIMLVENNAKTGDFKYDIVPIDFGYALTNIKEYNGLGSVIIPNKSPIMLSLVPEQIKKQALKEVVNEVERKKEELYKKIEDTCYALGIGERQARLVIEVINKNIELVKKKTEGIGYEL